MARLTGAAGVVAACLIAVTLQRAPLVWVDEVYFASAARSMASGGDGTPTVEPASAVSFPFPLLHGPIFFWLDGVALNWIGMSPAGGRFVSFAGALLTALAGAALVGLLTGSRPWALASFGMIMLTPEIGSAAANARMDTLAVGLEMSGLLAFVWGLSRPRRAALGGALAGVCWGAAMLTTTRAFPFGMAMTAAAAVALIRGRPFDRKALAAACAMTALLVASGLTAWSWQLGITPIDWSHRTFAAAQGTQNVAVSLGKSWSVSVTNVLTTALVVPALLALIAGPRRERATGGAIPFLLGAAILTATFPAIVGNDVFLRSIHFSLFLMVAAIGATGVLPDGARRRALVRWGACGILLMAGVRVIKTVDVFETWALRSPTAFDPLVTTHVPSGSVVVGYDEFYYYAVERNGSRFRSFRFDPWDYSTSALLAAWADRIHRQQAIPAQADFLLWPDDPHWPMPEKVQCARPFPVSRYDAGMSRSLLDRVPGLAGLGYLRRYPNTVLYRVPLGCVI